VYTKQIIKITTNVTSADHPEICIIFFLTITKNLISNNFTN
jgi:hypothetical protein